MSDFAKIVRTPDGKIVLFLKDQNDEGKPALWRMTEVEGVTAKLGVAFSDDDFGYESCDKAYEACGVEEAVAFRSRIEGLLEVGSESARQFCLTALQPLCAELVQWAEVGVIGEAPFFRKLTEMCELFAGVEYGRKVAENLVRHEAMRFVARDGVLATV